MKLNERSCLLDSFASILGHEPKTLAKLVGHDGPEGYHSQELIEVALFFGWAVTPIQRCVMSENPVTHDLHVVSFPEGEDVRFARHLSGREGVIMGFVPMVMKPHAVAWAADHVYDPAIDNYYSLLNEQGEVNDLNFIPQTFLRMDKL